MSDAYANPPHFGGFGVWGGLLNHSSEKATKWRISGPKRYIAQSPPLERASNRPERTAKDTPAKNVRKERKQVHPFTMSKLETSWYAL